MPIHLSATPTSAPIHTHTHSHRAHMSIFMAHPLLSSCELERARKRERETYINLYRCVRPNPYIEISFPIRFCFPFSPPSRFVFPFKQNGKGKQREREQKREKTESTKPALSLIFSLSLCRIVLRILGSDMASTMQRNTKEHPT